MNLSSSAGRPVCRASDARRCSRRGGFTLIEILVVIVVIAILATLVAPNIFKHVGAAKDATARSQMEMLGAALDAYQAVDALGKRQRGEAFAASPTALERSLGERGLLVLQIDEPAAPGGRG